jgi:acyl-coenzyme A synthetase/AMP-(fatty) acid ligase
MTKPGERLIPVMIDQLAISHPDRLHSAIPLAENDLSKGFKEVTYKQLANVINKASWWLDSKFGKSTGDFETFAYIGPRDLRYVVLHIAATKVGRVVCI